MTVGSAVEHIEIHGPAGTLEAVADESGAAGEYYGILCHPHPLHGGTMDNKVVTTLVRALREAGVPSVRFNFRGVGGSEGAYDHGQGETDDANAAASWGAARWPGRRLIIAGFSFGSYVAMRLAQQRPTARLITIAPPLALLDFTRLSAPDCPWWIVQGDADEVVDPGSVIEWAKHFDPQPHLVVMPGVGHFFHGRLQELRDAVIDSIRSD